MEGEIKLDPKGFWSFVHARRSSSRIPGVVSDGVSTYDSPEDIVQAFSNEFSASGSVDPGVIDSSAVDFSCMPSFCFGFSTPESMLRILVGMPNKLTAGDDQVPAFLVRDCRYVFASPLSTIVNLSIKNGVFPNKWKTTRVTPVFKKGDKSLISNYRPISILSNFAKAMEIHLFSNIFYHVKPYLSSSQHGFHPGRSTDTNLCCFTQFVSDSIDRGFQVDVIYTDFSRAFDRMSHSGLLLRLERLGFCESAMSVMRSYLHNRHSYVFFNGYIMSKVYATASGVPQGSNLGPLLFIIFMNDLLSKLRCEVLAYADDLKIFARIDNADDVGLLQTSLNDLVAWCAASGLALNIDKCCVVTYSTKSHPLIVPYDVGGVQLSRRSSIRDLGVLFDSKLSFAQHIEEICSAALKALGFILRTAKPFDGLEVLHVLYCAFVRSRLEYCSLVWYPHYIQHQLAVERVQRRFLKYLTFKQTGTYPARGVDYAALLLRHDIQSLQMRREIRSRTFLDRLVQGFIDCPSLLSSVMFHVPRISSRAVAVYRTPSARTNVGIRAPIGHMTRNANRFIREA